MSTSWEIDENAPPVDPPPESLEGEVSCELTPDDAADSAAGVVLPADAEGELT